MVELQKQLFLSLQKAVKMFYDRDFRLLELNVHEQTISHRIAVYLEQIICGTGVVVSVDCEYNRHLSFGKTIYDKCEQCEGLDCWNKTQHIVFRTKCDELKSCRPDIVVHTRGTDENNLLVVEFKKNTPTDNVDFAKLNCLTCNEAGYKYRLGAYVSLNKSDYDIKLFDNGSPMQQN
jgi:hypothetical protein